jgi:hypothetical protein
MGVTSKVALIMLAEKLEKGPCVSIYIPTHRDIDVTYDLAGAT